jgi:RNA polymerase sigma-70 factor, ECF subfamily
MAVSRCAYHVADYWRAHYRLPTHSLDALLETGWEGPAEEEPLARSESSVERVQRILQALPERYRKVLICRFLLKLSLRDTALSMGATVATIKTSQLRALKRAADLEDVVAEQSYGA